MEKRILILCIGLLALVPSLVAKAQGGEELGSDGEEQTVAVEQGDGCFPPCRSGYLCHPLKQECVQLCNPPCASGETCTEEGECVATGPPMTLADSPSAAEAGDLRFRLVLLGRFGLGGKLKNKFDDQFAGGRTTAEFGPEATLGFDLRFEKPAGKHVTAGALLSNYWWRLEGIDRQYALDISPFVKPRYPFRAGSKEAEVYLLLSFGGSLTVVEFVDPSGFESTKEVYGGFNTGFAPGFQIFVSSSLALIFEVGYAFSWFKIGGSGNEILTLGQATIRLGFAVAF